MSDEPTPDAVPDSNRTPIRVLRMSDLDYEIVRRAAELNRQNFSDFARVVMLDRANELLRKSSDKKCQDLHR